MAVSDLLCAIVAGGQGTRMRPLTEHLPKSLLPVRGVPLVDHQLDWLRAQGVRRVVVCLGHLAEPIESHLATATAARGFEIAISTEGASALGTAGAIRLAIERSIVSGRFLTLYGDTVPSFDLTAAREQWDASRAPALLCVYPAPYSGGEARAEVRGGYVVRFSRHPSAAEAARLTHGDYGVAGFDASQFAHLAPGTRGGFGPMHTEFAERRDLVAYDVGRPPLEVGTVEAYQRAVSRAIDAAVANAALEGIHIPDDERALIEAHQRGEISDSDFLKQAREIAQRKSGGTDG